MSKLTKVFRVRVSTESALRAAGFKFKRAPFRYDYHAERYGFGCSDPMCCGIPTHTGKCGCGCGEPMVALEVPLSGARFHKLVSAVAVPHTPYR